MTESIDNTKINHHSTAPEAEKSCDNRFVLDQIADKWSVLILNALCEKPLRFNQLKRQLDGITQKALTQTLRRLERNGILARRVIPASQVAVEYSITPLGRSLEQPFRALHQWTINYLPAVLQSQTLYDQQQRAVQPADE